ncbi:phosphoribosylanthranilate isomerase [Lactococcus termiticola]|uniref:N-(5'-phosphoribosyl)anthranilate isomerase n=1 Tax=Lactococcus termiticola TaxID=2169526 RepID=A0A2R5HHN6_9LACT|nr:phosphoribosylanthranilate isomerase [Lactococcus termiticola]GBG97563.1 phosphoribosylanthranilate isomerase [Lactococcus termiticola]
MKLKICGNMEKKSVDAAVVDGADFVGVIMSRSRRQITPEKAREILRDVPASVKKVGVFVNEPIDFVRHAIEVAKLDFAQLHGNESMDFVRELQKADISVIKAMSDFTKIANFKNVILLLDTPGGGSGKLADFSSVKFDAIKLPYFIAGGLTPDNIAEAVRKYPNAYGFDVSSGVEIGGMKDTKKICEFINRARTAKEGGKIVCSR